MSFVLGLQVTPTRDQHTVTPMAPSTHTAFLCMSTLSFIVC